MKHKTNINHIGPSDIAINESCRISCYYFGKGQIVSINCRLCSVGVLADLWANKNPGSKLEYIGTFLGWWRGI